MSKRPNSRTRTIVEPLEGRDFDVEAVDVKDSIVLNPEHCAAARACKRGIEGVVNAWVYRTRTSLLMSDGTVHRYKNPAALTKTIEGFDNTAGFFPPGTYKLNPINPGSRTERRKVLNEKNPKRENRGIRPHRQPKHRPGMLVR